MAKPAAAPGPVATQGIDQAGHEYDVQQISAEVNPFSNRPRYDGDNGNGKSRLEQPEGINRDREMKIGEITAKHKSAGAYQTAGIFAVHQPKSKNIKNQRSYSDIGEHFHDNVHTVFISYKTGLQQGETALHQQNHSGAQYDPNRIYSSAKGLQRHIHFYNASMPLMNLISLMISGDSGISSVAG
ncbi:hypothetical protein D3C73_799430 [compost metagenome]